jgi:uncharacterized membrane protein
MSRVWHKPAVLLMWLALPTAAWIYWRVWDHLPARMAVHFDANWQPNGYTSREGAVQLGLEILVVMLVLFTLATLIIDALKPAAFWPALLVSYAVLGFCWYGNYSIVDFNLKAQQEHSGLKRPISKSTSQFLVANWRSPLLAGPVTRTSEN